MDRQKIIIIGATSGIGKAIAEIYAGTGHRVGITGRRLDLLVQMKERFPDQVEYQSFDITGTQNIPSVEALVKKLGGLNILIICAGNGQVSENLDFAIDQQTVKTNVNGFVEIANWAFNFFVGQGMGNLATISSIAAYRGGSHAPAYNASKAFQSTYFEGLALKAEKLKTGIAITCVEPGFVDTRLAQSNKLFWVVPVRKAASQIITAIEKKKRKAYISRRWRIIAGILKWMPYRILKKII
jgi:short-subunit dehydrogenase